MSKVEMIKGGWLAMKVDDEVIFDANYPKGVKASELAKIERLCYNLTRSCFGYGSDAMDWDNEGNKWIEFEEMDQDEEGKLILYFDIGYFPCSWQWPDGTTEGVIAKIQAGHITDIYTIADHDWKDPGDHSEIPEDITIYASFLDALEACAGGEI